MSTIVTRAGKGSALTHNEVDANFTNLNTDKLQSGDTAAALTITTATIAGGTINNTTVGATTPAAGTFTSLTDSGNLTFTGTGNRITGDFSNSTIANRVILQTSTTNGQTRVTAIPNGTATTGIVEAFNSSDTTNASIFSLTSISTEARLAAGIAGTGTYQPMTFYTNNSERMRIDTSGNVLIGTSVENGVNYTVTTPSVQNVGTTENTSASSNVLWSTSATLEPHLILTKMKAATIGGTASAQVANDNIGRIAFVGSNGVSNTALEAANIFVEADGTFTSTAAPTRMLFSTGSSSGIATTRVTIDSDGLVTLDSTSGLSIGRTAVTSPAATDGNVFSGTYTPAQVSTNVNVAAISFVACQYMRVGNTVTVSGQILFTATASGTDTQVRISIPIASAFTATRQLGGSGAALNTGIMGTNGIVCIADSTNDCAEIRGRPTTTSSTTYNFSFTYQVI